MGKKKGFMIVVTLLLILFPSATGLSQSHSAEKTAETESWQTVFKQQVEHWINELYHQDERFQAWKGAAYDYQGLGPHSKEWMISVYRDDKALGYMIVGENPPSPGETVNRPSFSLLEYGLGTPLFEGSPEDATIIYGGLESFWRENGALIDARTGETFPNTIDPSFVPETPNGDVSGAALLSGITRSAETLDPFEDIFWLDQHAQKLETEQDVMRSVEKAPVVLVSDLYQNKVLAPFTVAGYHLWTQMSGETKHAFIELNDQGARFLPLSYCLSKGSLKAK
ncbi:MAG: hypothetical protein H0Z33_05160 [Bacillaceae bacterium]|nr:hypothetical protein [Bacillaceae bacterium]